MAEADDDAVFFETIPLTVTHHFPSRERPDIKTWSVNAESFQEMARVAKEQTDSLEPAVRCVVSTKGTTEARFSRREHFVPEGLGFGWTAPPIGVGTCDDINAAFGKYEGEWLRQGKMGIFRPFYVADGKDGAPEYYAPKKTTPHVSFTRDEDGRRTLRLSHAVTVDLPDRSGPADVVIRVPHTEARVEWLSLALHKMALLMFWLCEGPLAFDVALTDTRRFLLGPGEPTYRSFIEHMQQGACPGVELRYLVKWRPVGERRAEIDTVHCTMKVHHMRYAVTLAGEPPPPPSGLVWTPWADPAATVPDRTPIVFRAEGLESVPVVPRPQA